ncbi:hypothetical protein GmHk_12G034945 [Glycine max]|nr:hypothetical protein GmHk_12G034945 [Glycine max]
MIKVGSMILYVGLKESFVRRTRGGSCKTKDPNAQLFALWDTTCLCVSQPTIRREGDAGLTSVSSKGGRRAESPPMIIQGKCRKNRNMWSTNFNCERFESCSYARGRY